MVEQTHPEITGDCVWNGRELALSTGWLRTWPESSEQVFETDLASIQAMRVTIDTMTKSIFPLGPLEGFLLSSKKSWRPVLALYVH